MGWFIIAIIVAVLAVVGFFIAQGVSRSAAKTEARAAAIENDSYKRERLNEAASDTRGVAKLLRIVAGAVTAIAVLFLAFSMIFTQGVGEAKVIVNADGTIAGQKLDPGFGVKAPWQETVDFDLFSQEVLYAGGNDAPSYSGGEVSGKEVTVAVGGVSGGSTQANLDVSIVYSLDADQVTPLYKKYKSQERFTKQVVEKTILSAVRQIPADYNAIDFRGTKRQEAADKMLKVLNDRLNEQGITVDFVNIQDVRYPETVETALKEVEVANQNVQKAEAEQRSAEVAAETAKIKAEGEAQAAIAKAQGEAEANRLIAASLSPAVLAKLQIDAYGEGTVFTIPEGATPFVTTGK